MSRLIATVYLPGQGINRALPTGPGRKLEFRGGAAFVTDERDMPFALSMAGAKVEVEPQHVDFLPQWAAHCTVNQPAVAQASVSGPEADNYDIGRPPLYEVLRRATPPVEPPVEPPSRDLGSAWSGPRRVLRTPKLGEVSAVPTGG